MKRLIGMMAMFALVASSCWAVTDDPVRQYNDHWGKCLGVRLEQCVNSCEGEHSGMGSCEENAWLNEVACICTDTTKINSREFPNILMVEPPPDKKDNED